MIDRKALTGQAARPSTAYDYVTVMVGLSQDEADLVEWLRRTKSFRAMQRLREMYNSKHHLAIVQFTEKGLRCREVGKMEG